MNTAAHRLVCAALVVSIIFVLAMASRQHHAIDNRLNSVLQDAALRTPG